MINAQQEIFLCSLKGIYKNVHSINCNSPRMKNKKKSGLSELSLSIYLAVKPGKMQDEGVC